MEIITPQQAQEWIEAGKAVLFDVREDDEFRGEHIAGAVSEPLSRFRPEHVAELAGDKKIILQCLSGKRSQMACQQFLALTGKKPYRFQGCLTGWKQAGLPTEKAG
ncbi:MAG: rhodanese-like domain-containing protein [Rhodospirillales bacterium]|nr:rhodanese-like domain-containing protein [Rhodospirillales bacterium]